MAYETLDGVTRAALIARVRRLTADGSAKRLRKRAHLSLGDVGRALGVAPPTVLRWERCEVFPRPDVAVRYGALLVELMELDSPEEPE